MSDKEKEWAALTKKKYEMLPREKREPKRRQKVVYPFLTKEFVEENYLTLDEFARLCGCRENDVRKLLRKETAGLSTRQHAALCKEFGKDVVGNYYDLAPALEMLNKG